MSVLEVAIWSAACGAIGLVVLICLVDFVILRSTAAAQGMAYHVVALLFVTVLSGMPQVLLPQLPREVLHVAQVLVGPICVFGGDFWIRAWFSARHRDRLMDTCLVAAGLAGPIGGALCLLLLPTAQQLPASAAIVLVNTGLILWMGVRAWMLGDPLALGIAIGCAFMLPAVGGLYAVALGIPGIGLAWQATIALAAVVCLALIGTMVWRRNRQERSTRGLQPVHSQYDPVTKLAGGVALVRQLVRAQERRRSTRADGALLAVMLFDTDKLMAQIGSMGLNEVYVQVARRLQRQVGLVNPVGRYWDRCFVSLVETVHSPASLRSMGLRVASSLRKPMHVSGADGQSVQVRVDIGVGVVHLTPQPAEVEDLLHEAQRLAEAARGFASRAAMADTAGGEAVPVEHAQLAPRQRPRRVRAGQPDADAANEPV